MRDSDSGELEKRTGFRPRIGEVLALCALLSLAYCARGGDDRADDDLGAGRPITASVDRVSGETGRETCERRYGVPGSLCAKSNTEGDEITIPLESVGR